MDFPPWEWDVTWGEMIFLAEGEVGLEAEVARFLETPEDERPAWPDEAEIENYRVTLWEIDRHAVAGTLDDFRAYIAERMETAESGERRDRQWQLHGPWIKKWVNLWRVLNGPDNVARKQTTELAIESLGLRADPKKGKIGLSDFAVHPRTRMGTLGRVPRYRKPRGRPSVQVPWGTEDSQAAMNYIRSQVASGVEIAEAARLCAMNFEENQSENRPKDLAKLYRKKVALRGNIGEALAGE